MAACEAYQEGLLALAEGELQGGDRARVEAHAGACPACRAELVAIRETLELARGIPVPEPPERFWEEFAAEVGRRVRQEAPARQAPAPAPSLWERLRDWLPLRPVPAMALAAAAVLVVALGLLSTRHGRPGPQMVMAPTQEEISLAANLDVLEVLDVLENIEVLENLDLLRRMDGEGRPVKG